VFDAIKGLIYRLKVNGEEQWSGTATQLLGTLGLYADDDIKRSRAWPGGPQALSRKMRRLAPALRSAGIEYSENEVGREKRRVKTLRQVGPGAVTDHRHNAPETLSEPAKEEPDAGEAEGEPVDSAADDGYEEDYLAELSERAWHRDDGALDLSPETLPEGGIDLRADPVVRELRHRVPIDYGPRAPWHVPISGPQVFDAEEAWNWEARDKTEEELRSMGWPGSPEEMRARLKRVIPLLRERPYPFSDPKIADFYEWESEAQPGDPEVLCTKGRLHVELWRNEETSEELYALIALRPGCLPPRKEIEYAVSADLSFRNPIPDDEREISEADESGFVF